MARVGKFARASLRPPARRCLAGPRRSGLDAPQMQEKQMRRSTSRILTTHTGSLPRPAKVVELLLAERRGIALDAAVEQAVADVIARQKEAHLDIINDG